MYIFLSQCIFINLWTSRLALNIPECHSLEMTSVSDSVGVPVLKNKNNSLF